MEIDILRANESILVSLTDVSPNVTLGHLKKLICKEKRSLYPERVALRLEPKSKMLSDDVKLNTLTLKQGKVLYFKDLGPQIGWKTVFLWEYFGPLVCYLATYLRPTLIYGKNASLPMHPVVTIAAACWSFHYLKRLYETLFVHRFSHATMPLMNLFKNCAYYWGFAFYIGYYVNHPLYTSPYFGNLQIYLGLLGFLICEIGNYSIHILLRDLRPAGSKERKIPVPTSNPFTILFNFVSCPNYTYEVGSWVFFTLMTQCLPVGVFTVAGFYQMAVWALGKHRNYKKEFEKYPKNRKAIVPFLI